MNIIMLKLRSIGNHMVSLTFYGRANEIGGNKILF